MEITDGNDGVLAAEIALAATMQSFVGSNMAHRVLIISSHQEHMHTLYQTKARRVAGRDRISRLDMGLQPTKLLLRLTEQLLV